MTTKHTPGPWRYGEAVGSFSHYRVDAGNNTPVVAAVISEEANARLIAAAPKLLEALQRLESKGLLQTLIDMDENREDDEPPIAEADVKFARAAIAKATGDA